MNEWIQRSEGMHTHHPSIHPNITLCDAETADCHVGGKTADVTLVSAHTTVEFVLHVGTHA